MQINNPIIPFRQGQPPAGPSPQFVSELDSLLERTTQNSLKILLNSNFLGPISTYPLKATQVTIGAFKQTPTGDYTPMISIATASLYAKEMASIVNKEKEISSNHNFNIPQFSQDTITVVINPALFSRNLLIRHPFSFEKDEVQKLFSNEDLELSEDKANIIFSQLGIFDNNGTQERVIVICGGENHSEILGAAHYIISPDNENPEEKNCTISSFITKEGMENQGIGSLLLSTILMEALNQNSMPQVTSLFKAAPFYLSFGFLPGMRCASMAFWDELPFEKKCRIAESYILMFDFSDESMSIFSHRLSKALNADTYENISRSQHSDLKRIKMPEDEMNAIISKFNEDYEETE